MISLFFLGITLAAFFWYLYYSTHWSRNLTVSLDFLQNNVYAGEQAQLQEQIENRKRLTLPVLEVAFHVDKRLSFPDCENTNVSDFLYKRDIFALLGNQRVTRKLTLDCTKRGYYRIGQSDLTTYSMLHRRRFSTSCPADTELYVYAARTDVSDILVSCERLLGNVQCAKRLYEDPFAFSSIREYTTADPMNTINWKASARTGSLMVNTYESTVTEKVMIYLDMEDSGILKHEHLIEESVSVAATLAQRLIGRGMEVGVWVNVCADAERGDGRPLAETTAADRENLSEKAICIPPSGGKKQLAIIEQTLAKRRSDEKIIPFLSNIETLSRPQRTPQGQSSHGQPEDTVTVFISKNATLNRANIEKLMDRTRQALWVIPYTRNDVCDVKTPDNIRLIKREVSVS